MLVREKVVLDWLYLCRPSAHAGRLRNRHRLFVARPYRARVVHVDLFVLLIRKAGFFNGLSPAATGATAATAAATAAAIDDAPDKKSHPNRRSSLSGWYLQLVFGWVSLGLVVNQNCETALGSDPGAGHRPPHTTHGGHFAERSFPSFVVQLFRVKS